MSTLYREISGVGPVLVLWHGWGSNLSIFDELRQRLASDFVVPAIDLPGCGRSAAAAALDADTQWQLLCATLPTGASLLGWSLGGQWALRAAREMPGRLRALVLVHTTPRFVSGGDWTHGVTPAVMAGFGAQLQQDLAGCLGDFLTLQLRGERGAAPAPQQLRDRLMLHGHTDESVLARGLKQLSEHDLRAGCAHVTTPALVVAGQHDRITPPAAARALAAALPAAQYLEIARAAHLSFLSHPDAFVAALRAFLFAHSRQAA
jgi:pimeloyl-[acyl-carrier protein] methyl ester esterase